MKRSTFVVGALLTAVGLFISIGSLVTHTDETFGVWVLIVGIGLLVRRAEAGAFVALFAGTGFVLWVAAMCGASIRGGFAASSLSTCGFSGYLIALSWLLVLVVMLRDPFWRW
jgi:hypothetical protein